MNILAFHKNSNNLGTWAVTCQSQHALVCGAPTVLNPFGFLRLLAEFEWCKSCKSCKPTT